MKDLIRDALQRHMNEIDDNNFDGLYHDVNVSYDDVGRLTEILFDAGIEPHNYMTIIPQGYLAHNKQIYKVVIPEGVTSIEDCAFFSSRIVEVMIPRSVKSIRRGAFSYCSDLKSIIYNGTADEWEEIAKDKTWCRYSDYFTVKCLGDLKISAVTV